MRNGILHRGKRTEETGMSMGKTRYLKKLGAPALALLGAMAFGATSASAQQVPSCTQEPSSSASKALDAKIQKTVIEVQELLEAEQYSQALGKLQGIRDVQEMKAYDQAVISQLFAQVYLDQDKYEEGVKHLENVIRKGCGQQPLEQMNQMIFNIGQIYIAIGAEKDGATAQNYFKRGIDTLEAWFRDNPNARPDPYAMLAVAYLQIDPPNYQNGIKWLEKAISKAQELGEEPKEGWYRNVAQLYLEINQPQKSLPILEMLVQKYGSRDYWLQLAFVYGELGRETDQFTTLEAAHHQGLLTKGQEQFYLAQLYITNDMPKRAADIVDAGFKSKVIEREPDRVRFLADAYYTAKELDSAIKWYKEAGKVADRADPLFFLGQIYMQKESWKEAIEAFNDAIEKDRSAPQGKKFGSIGTAHFNVGVANYYLEDFDAAKRAFGNAKGYSAVRDPAQQWLNRLEREGAN